MTKYAYSHDQELYHGQFDSRESAAAEGLEDEDVFDVCWTGKCRDPVQPDVLFSESDVLAWLENVAEYEDYLGDWGSDWDGSTLEQRKELAEQIRPLLTAWLDKHDLRPTFYNIIEVEEHTRET